ncbi:MAG TPA: hypothetical protein VME24_01000 [Alphaproteobacteria bacterium]|nr:hypothetical protein [Alphaproteobacteria bacterium]
MAGQIASSECGIISPTQEGPTHLLGAIKSIWARVGNVLNDIELTCFLQKTAPSAEAGFTFLSFSCGYVTLTVPSQRLENWYAAKGWITKEKESIAKNLAKKYGLLLYEPLDDSLVLYPELVSSITHHHLAFSDQRQTVIIAHPLFLKICLYGRPPDHLYWHNLRYPLPLGPDLLQDILPLYNCESDSGRTDGAKVERARQKQNYTKTP